MWDVLCAIVVKARFTEKKIQVKTVLRAFDPTNYHKLKQVGFIKCLKYPSKTRPFAANRMDTRKKVLAGTLCKHVT